MSNLWYVLKAGQVHGPFPGGALVQDRLLGRLGADELLSTDRDDWHPFAYWPQLSQALEAAAKAAPEQQPGWNAERAKARARWADQRTGEERRAASEEAGKGERRGERRSKRATAQRTARASGVQGLLMDYPVWKLILALAVLVMVIAVLVHMFGAVNPIAVDIRR
ncbi:MAG: hypothetical protein ABI612_25605 [Betaproteobacteria bacterium]